MAVLARAHTAALAFLAAFVLLSVFYSAPPIRAKARPVIDSAFNILYAMPGLFGYALAGGGTPSAAVVVASACWTMAMHAYSAVPDIEADREAGLATIATLLGARATILLCLALYAASALLAYRTLGPVSAALGAVYGMLMLVSLRLREPSAVMAIYRRFPAVNAVCGFLIFLAIFLSHHLQM
jgi:4-hydroxybenzoate polyprenyltransferase